MALYHDVILIEADNNAFIKFASEKPDIVFNIAEGMNGLSREAQIPSMLEFLGIPYTASDPITLSICHHKARAKEVLSYHKIPNSKFLVSYSGNGISYDTLSYPLVIKPVAEGSSKGIYNSSFIQDQDQLASSLSEKMEKYQQPFIIEEFLPGREFTVAVMGNGIETEVLPIVEINYAALPKDIHPIYSYEAKWILDSPEHQLEMYLCPADISESLENKIRDVTLRAYNALGCRDWSRIDIRLDSSEEPNIIEVNPLPGILPDPKNNSCYPKASRQAGLSYEEMINNVLYFAAKRINLI